jgi:DNA-binding GntR family transcriptional regulator
MGRAAATAETDERDTGARPAAARAPGLASLAPVARPTVTDSVYEELRRSLIAGAIDAGQVLRIRDLAGRLSVSTMPVREALARLATEGALELTAGRTARVPPITRARLDDLEASRRLIEGGLLARALPRLGAADIAELRRLTALYDDLAPPAIDASAATADLNRAFHFAVYRAAGSEILLPIVESLWTQSGPVIRRAAALFERRPSPAATEHHHRIIAAVEAGDAAAAADALGDAIGRAFALVRETL